MYRIKAQDKGLHLNYPHFLNVMISIKRLLEKLTTVAAYHPEVNLGYT